jgi:hypothetical protein
MTIVDVNYSNENWSFGQLEEDQSHAIDFNRFFLPAKATPPLIVEHEGAKVELLGSISHDEFQKILTYLSDSAPHLEKAKEVAPLIERLLQQSKPDTKRNFQQTLLTLAKDREVFLLAIANQLPPSEKEFLRVVVKMLLSKVGSEGELILPAHPEIFVQQIADALEKLGSEDLTPNDVVKLFFFSQKIEQSPLSNRISLQKQIAACQEKWIEKMPPQRRLALAKILQNWRKMDVLRERLFPHLYARTQERSLPAMTSVPITNGSWRSQEQVLIYLIERAKELKTRSNASVMDNIISRAERNLELLRRGQSVKIPSYYHGTKSLEKFELIAKSSILSQVAKEGKGAYVSTQMETKYGTMFFAFDRRDLESAKLSQTSTVNANRIWPESDGATWRALDQNIPILVNVEGSRNLKKLNVAYLVASDQETRQQMTEALARQNLAEKPEIILLEEARLEQKLLHEIEGAYEPSSWSAQWKRALDEMSKFMARVKSAAVPSDDDNSAWDD